MLFVLCYRLSVQGKVMKKEKIEVVDFFEYLDCMNGLAFFVIRGLFLESVSTFLFSLWPIWQPTKNVRVSFKLP